MGIVGTRSNSEARVGQFAIQVPVKIHLDFGAFLSTNDRHETRFNLIGTEWGVALEFTRDSQSSRGFDVVRQGASDSPQYLAAFIYGTNKTQENLNLNLEVDFELKQGPARWRKKFSALYDFNHSNDYRCEWGLERLMPIKVISIRYYSCKQHI